MERALNRLRNVLRNVDSCTRPIFIQTSGLTDIGHEIVVISEEIGVSATLIDCSLLLEPTHIYGQVVEGTMETPDYEESDRRDLCSQSSFLEAIRNLDTSLDPLWVCLDGCEHLLNGDPKVLWTLLHISDILPTFDVPLRFILISHASPAEYYSVFNGITPVTIDVTLSFKIPEVLRSVAGRCCPEGMEPQSLLKFLEYLYNRVKDEIADEESFLRVTKRVLPTILQICQDRGVSLEDTAKIHTIIQTLGLPFLSKDCFERVQSIVIEDLSLTERFLLIATYIAGNNPVKFDLKLFGNRGKRTRVHATSGNAKARRALQEKAFRSAPKAVFLDRILAIFYFIAASSPVPSLSEVYGALTRLTKKQLLERCSSLNRLDQGKYRCKLSFEMITAVSSPISFQLGKYLEIYY